MIGPAYLERRFFSRAKVMSSNVLYLKARVEFQPVIEETDAGALIAPRENVPACWFPSPIDPQFSFALTHAICSNCNHYQRPVPKEVG